MTDVLQDQALTARARIADKLREPGRLAEVRDPWRGDLIGHFPVSDIRDCDDAMASAFAARDVMAAMPAYERAAMLDRAADNVAAQAPQIGRMMSRETGKALRDCVVEVQRAADILRLSGQEGMRIEGEHIPMDASATGAGKIAMMLRFPVGVVAAITPFNGPTNLAAHKLGPALAAGNSIVLKPSPKASLCTYLMVEAMIEAGIPDGAINTLYGDEISPVMVAHPAVDFVSFTGSTKVGKLIRASVGMKRVALELGGVGPTFVHKDADLSAAAKACARNGLLLAGQSCVSVQNIYVHRDVQTDFAALLKREVAAVRFGDPLDPETEVGTLIDEAAAMRVEGMVARAIEAGAGLLCEGQRKGAQLTPNVLIGLHDDMEIVADEVFGPAINLLSYDNPDPVFRKISDSPFGLQAGIFTNSLDLAMKAFRNLRTGGVILNGTSRWRSDQMPYGGVKESGIGREGPKFSIRDMTEERLLVIT